MALIAVAADKGAPGVTTTALALASVWPGPVLLAECDPAGGDLAFRFPAADGRQLDPRTGLLSLAVAGRRDYQQQQVWPHTQKIHGGLDVLLGVTNAEQGAGLSTLWGPLGKMLAALPGADVIADCGRLGPDGPFYDLLAEADSVLLVTRPDLGDVIRLRDRAAAVVTSAGRRGRTAFAVDLVTLDEPKRLRDAGAEVAQAVAQSGVPVRLSCGLADDPKGAELLRGAWGGKLDKSLLMRTARQVAGELAAHRPPPAREQGPPREHAPVFEQREHAPVFEQRSAYRQTPMRRVPPGPAPAAAPPLDPPSGSPPGPVPVFRPRHVSRSPEAGEDPQPWVPQADGTRGR